MKNTKPSDRTDMEGKTTVKHLDRKQREDERTVDRMRSSNSGSLDVDCGATACLSVTGPASLLYLLEGTGVWMRGETSQQAPRYPRYVPHRHECACA